MSEVIVVGAGYAGVELAASVAERLRGRAHLQLVTAGFSRLLVLLRLKAENIQ